MAEKSVWKICLSVCLSLPCVMTAVVPSRTLFPLDLIHYNDFHDRFEETSVQFPICTTNDTNCIGGFPRLYHEIKTLQREKPDAVILNAGDAFQGTYWYTLLQWNVTQHFINMLPLDAHTLGNHEFDGGIEGLAPYLAALRAPMVVANIDTRDEPLLKGLYKPHIVVERKGRKIGIIGVITPETKITSKTEDVIFLNPIKAVQKQAQLLTDQGVDIIIVLSHCGINVDKQMAKEVSADIDIIVGGHTHSLLWNEKTAPSNEAIVGPYPIIVESGHRRGQGGSKKVLVVTASAFTKYLGNLTVYFDGEGELITFDGGPIFLNRSIPEDPEIKAEIQPYIDHLHKIVNEVVGRTEAELSDTPCAGGECVIGDLITDSMLNATNEYKISGHPSVALLPRIYIRGRLPSGDITRGNIINTLPFGNKVVSFTIKGQYLLEALDKCMSSVWQLDPFTGPFMPQVAGMKVTVDTNRRKVESVLIHGDGLQPLDLDKVYQVTTVDFLANGGNGFEMLQEHRENLHVIGVDFEILESYIKKITLVKDQLDNRLVTVSRQNETENTLSKQRLPNYNLHQKSSTGTH